MYIICIESIFQNFTSSFRTKNSSSMDYMVQEEAFLNKLQDVFLLKINDVNFSNSLSLFYYTANDVTNSIMNEIKEKSLEIFITITAHINVNKTIESNKSHSYH